MCIQRHFIGIWGHQDNENVTAYQCYNMKLWLSEKILLITCFNMCGRDIGLMVFFAEHGVSPCQQSQLPSCDSESVIHTDPEDCGSCSSGTTPPPLQEEEGK